MVCLVFNWGWGGGGEIFKIRNTNIYSRIWQLFFDILFENRRF